MLREIKTGEWIETRYRIERPLGEGGMSVVFEAYDKQEREKVALKFLKEKVTSTYVEDQIRFKREAEAVSKLEHKGIIKVKGIGYYEDRPYLIEEVLEGESLSDRMDKEKTVTAVEAVNLVRELSEVLEYVHARGIIHRDIKPANIFITKEGKVKLIDFGIAHVMELSEIKEKKEIVGTFGYMSPEATGMMNRPVDERSDLYSLGVVLFEMLSGKLPFEGEDVGTILHRQVSMKAPRLREVKKGTDSALSGALDEIVQKLLEKEQELRYQSAKGLRYDLERYEKGDKDFIIGEKDQKVKLSYQSKLVGREKELSRLKEICDGAKGGKGKICLVGEPGVGKTRLVDGLKDYAYEKGYQKGGLYLRGRCLNQANKTPYQVFRDVLNEYVNKFQKMEEVDQAKERERLKKVAGMLGRIIIQMNPNMGEVLGEVPELVKLEPEKENKRFLMTASDFLLELAPEGEISILFLDDLQWSDEGSLGLLKEMSGKIDRKNVLIVGTYRTEEVGPEHNLMKVMQEGEGKIERIELKRFNTERMAELTAAVLGEEKQYAGELGEYLLKKTEGNPFFAITVLRELVEEKALVWNDGRWREDWEKIKGLKFGDNIIELVLKRIGELNAEQDNMLCLAAMIGREFELELLYRLTEKEKTEIIQTVDELIGMQLIEEGQEHGKLLFVHDRIREAFLSKIEDKKAKDIHRRIAEQLEVLQEKETDKEKYLFDLVQHYIKAEDKEKSLKYLLPAAEKAQLNYVNEEAEKYYLNYLAIHEELKKEKNEKWVKIKLNLFDVYLNLGRNIKAIEEANQILLNVRDKLSRSKIYCQIGSAYRKTANFKKSEEYLIKSFKELNVTIAKSTFVKLIVIACEFIIHYFHRILFFIYIRERKKKMSEKISMIISTYDVMEWMYGFTNFFEAVYIASRSMVYCEKNAGKSRYLSMIYSLFMSGFCLLTLFPLAKIYGNMSLKMSRDINDPVSLASSLQHYSYYYSWIGMNKRSIETLKECLLNYQKIGDLWNIALVHNNIGHALRYLGNYEDSLSEFQIYLDISQKINDNYGISSAQSYLALAYIEMGDYELAEKLNQKALKLCEAESIIYNQCFTNIHMGILYYEKGQAMDSIPHLEKARKIFENNFLLLDWTILVYHHLANALINSVDNQGMSKELKNKIRDNCVKALRKEKPWKNHYGSALMVYARYLFLIGKVQKAGLYFKKSKKINIKYERKYELGKTHYEYGKFLTETGRSGEAVREWEGALKIFREIGSKEYVKRTEGLLGIKSETAVKAGTSSTVGEILPQERLALERQMTTVMETSRYLSSILVLEELLEKIMDKTMELMGAQRGILYLYPEGNEGKGAQGLKPSLVRMSGGVKRESFQASVGILEKIVREQKPLIVNDATTEADLRGRMSIVAESVKSVMGAPIMVRNKLYGVVYLDNSEVSSLFKEKDLDVLGMISNQAGISIENALLYRSLKDKERLKREMEIAERIQTAILPKKLAYDELEITAVMKTATEVGGDFYDVQKGPDGKVWLAIGDVMGHGVTPGLIMMMAQSVFSAEVREAGKATSLDEVMKMMNRILYENIQNRMEESYYMTLQFARYEGSGKVKCAAGGHPYMVWYRKGAGDCVSVEATGTLIGIKEELEENDIQEKEIEIGIGDILVMYTDGVTESKPKDGEEMYGIERLKACVKANSVKPLEEIKAEILKEVDTFSAGYQSDDVTMVMMRRGK